MYVFTCFYKSEKPVFMFFIILQINVFNIYRCNLLNIINNKTVEKV